jgi:hypothetical protein
MILLNKSGFKIIFKKYLQLMDLFIQILNKELKIGLINIL